MDGLSWGRALQNINIGLKLSAFAGPGHWNNLGLLAFGHQSAGQNRAQFSIYCIMASPLLMSGPLLSISPYNLDTYSNQDAIAINQDPLGNEKREIIRPCCAVFELNSQLLRKAGGPMLPPPTHTARPLKPQRPNTCNVIAVCVFFFICTLPLPQAGRASPL